MLVVGGFPLPPSRATQLAIKRSGVSAIYLEVGSFRDFVIENSYGEIVAHWGNPPPEN